MYVWARMAKMAATVKSRGPFRLGDVSRLVFRCLPSDIDSNLHMNNARYPMLADVGRYDIFLRSGLVRLWREHRWVPMMGGIQCVFLREIRLWRRFEILSSLEMWEDRHVIGKHRFLLDGGERACEIFTTAGIYDQRNRRFVPMDEVMTALGVSAVSRAPTEAESLFLSSHQAIRIAAKQDAGGRLDNSPPAD